MKLLAQTFLLSLVLASSLCYALEIPALARKPAGNLSPSSLLLGSVQEVTKWERFSPENEEFSVLLPTQLSVTNYVRPMLSKSRLEEGRLYSAYQDGTVYVLISIDNPNRRNSLEVIKDEILANEAQQIPVIDNRERVETKVSRNGVNGVQYRSNNERLSSISEFYVADNHIYFFSVYSEDINQPAVKQFLSSIAVGNKAKAKAMKLPDAYQPVIQNPTAPRDSSNTIENKVFNPKDVNRKASIITRPKPQYTEEARRNAVEGTVVLRAVFSSSGEVVSIKAIKGLPDGLTEKAIAAARNIRFIPAKREGQFVSQYIQIEYNFHLY